MMNVSNKAIIDFSTSTSSSRLSPLARPFTISNPLNCHESFDPLLDSSSSSSSSTSGFDQPFPYPSLGGQGHHGYYAYHSDATSITAFPCVDDLDFEPNSRFAYYPLEEPPVHTHFTLPTNQSSQTSSSSSLGNVGQSGVKGTAVDQQGREIPHNKDQIGIIGSLSCNNLLEQGSQDTQSQLSYSAPLMTWNHSDSTIITNESCIPHLGSLGAETLVSCGPDCFSYSAQIFKPSSASSNPPIVNPVPLENVTSSDTDAVSNRDSYFGYVVPSVINADIVQNPVDNVACHDQAITEKGEKRKILELVHNGIKNPSIVAKSKLQIACPNVPEDLTLEQHGAKAGIPDDKSSSNHDDSDVDSPCWNGAQAYNTPLRATVPVNSEDSKVQSPSRVSVPLKLEHSKNEKVARNGLNPLAPLFIPGNSKQKVDYHQKVCHGDSSSSFQKIAALASREQKLMDSVKSGTCPSERINDIGIQCSIDDRDSRKGYGVPYKSFRSSAVNSSCGFQSYLRKEYVTSENQLVRGTSVAGSMDGILDAIHNELDSVEDIVHNRPNTSITFLTSEIGLNSHSIGVGIFSEPSPYLSFGGQGHHGYYAYHSDATSITAFPCVEDLDFEPNSRFAYYLLEEPPVHTHFTLSTHQSSQTSSSSNLGNMGQSGVKGTSVDQQGREIPHNKDQIGIVGSLSCNNLLEQGTTVEGSKLVSETTSVLHGKGSVVIGKDNQIRPEDKEKIHTESSIFVMANSEVNLLNKCMTKPFSISSDLSFSPGPQYAEIQLSYSAPLMTLNHSDSTIITNESCIPHLGSLGAETLVSCGPDCFSYSAQIFKPSSAISNPPIVNPVPLENVASSDTDAVSNRDSYFGYVVPSVIDADIVQNPVDKVACHDQVIKEKGEKRKILEPVHNGIKNPSIVAKSKLQFACTNVPEDLTLEQHGAKAGIPDDKSSTNDDDSDVDSPCWKGAQAYKSPLRDTVPVNSEDSRIQSPSRVSMPLKLEHSKNEKVARNSLNPLAPMFIPGNSKQKVDYHQKECHGDSSSSFQKIAALASREHKLIDSVKSGTCPSERINDIGIQCSSDSCDSRKEYGVPYKSFRGSAVNSSCGFQPYLKEEYVTSEDQLVRGTSVAGSMDGILDAIYNGLDSVEDIVHNGPNTSISFLTSEIGLNSHSIGVGIFSDFTERLQEPSKSSTPKIEVKLMINTIQYFSELLLQNFSFDLGSLSEHELDKLLNIINNLYVIRNKAGQMTVRPEFSDPCTLYGQTQPADYDEEMHKTPAPMLSSRMLYSLYQSNDDEGFRKDNDISQIEVIEKDPKVIHSIENEMPPEALFYRKLWLEAKAALNLMKYQAHALHMKSELDRC
ncbi:hypothetical protein CRYUN_Cryun12cG0069500 [Craigia yunnanensis]